MITPHALYWTDQCFAGIGSDDIAAVKTMMQGEQPVGIVNDAITDDPLGSIDCVHMEEHRDERVVFICAGDLYRLSGKKISASIGGLVILPDGVRFGRLTAKPVSGNYRGHIDPNLANRRIEIVTVSSRVNQGSEFISRDMAALILTCTPIFLPTVKNLGMDPVQFGIMLMMNLGLGLCTPPVGACLFVECAVGKVPIEDALKAIWPFYLAILAALLLVTYVPAISLPLPNLLCN